MNPLFLDRLSRAQIMAMVPKGTESQNAGRLSIAVFRNHAFEYAASAVNAFLALSNVQATFSYSGYDDSFSFAAPLETADAHLLWIDASRYALPDVGSWLSSRIDALRQKTNGRILTVCSGRPDLTPAPQDGLFLHAEDVVAPLGAAAWDFERETLTGTKLSGLACLHIARELGARQIPALLFPPLKALALDLDNTLYAGVLGEDGPDAVTPHHELQTHLLALREQGFMLAIASKNEEADVRDLFSRRPDFPLRWEDFAAAAVNWKPKAENLKVIAETLNISLDAMLFIDDNPGEILHASRALPDLHTLEAADPKETLAALRFYPGLYKPRPTEEDRLRTADIRANAERNRLQKETTPEDYMRELAIRLKLHANDHRHIERAADLLNKTNQFILSFLRPTQADVASYLTSPDKCMVTLSLSDKLSDSGVVAVALVGKKGTTAHLDELAFSCRALGRGIESEAVCRMVALACDELKTKQEVRVNYTTGPRNKPALLWLRRFAGQELAESGSVAVKEIPNPEQQPGLQVNDVAVPGE